MRMQPQPWHAKELALYVLLVVGGLFMLFFIRSLLLLVIPSLAKAPSFIPFLLLIEYIILMGPVGIILTRERHHHVRVPVQLPLAWPGWRRTFLEPVAAWVLFIVGLTAIVQLLGGNVPGVTGEHVSIAGMPQNWLATSLLLVTAGIVAPVAEELLFRGIILPACLQWVRPTGAIIVSSVLFALLHNQGGVFITLFILGLLAGYFAWKNNSIWPAVVLHFLNNAAALVVDYTGIGA